MNKSNVEQSGYQELELKINELKVKKRRMFITAGICFAAAVIFLLGKIIIAAIPVFIAVLLFLFKGIFTNRQLKQTAKSDVVREALEEIFTECTYDPHGRIEEIQVRDAGLIDEWDSDRDSFDTEMYFSYTGNDHFIGKYKGWQVECCDAQIVKVTKVAEEDSEGNRSEREDRETVFKGIWMICRLEKSLPAAVRVREKAERASLFKKIAGERIRAKSDVETENSAFNEQFQILTNDAHSAFYILTPHFMEHILSADNKAEGRTMLCFSGSLVHIAVHNGRDSFKVRKASDADDIPALKSRIRSEISYLTGILDELFLNDRLFAQGELKDNI